ncbi:phosphate-starvation-inducible protein PsiE [Lysinibacillus sphaericus]|uniref:Protein PsiE n=4 Tax=Lysinibacillus TaxID=400634 RepID=A0A2S0JV12_LYSSH|nr:MULTISPECIES: phosphate-starvation-inducible protein PsiE [Lysinibacillus]AHN23820.1 phosphate-starvation-inducible protein PsiE [Lysinibacillus varians]AVK94918.1 phosphate-starvation-inducible protein PsiE [Lysinibacillus sphaericus]MCS1383443.1 phosphate-starvation-inducible protein PsiE [Lysinibacillus sphaericus]MED4544196.1 phosphate-starvation-inducible protein PsiE [Lysinibacillus sphaericus]TKI18670.1 phosphate-starvation-inducible protein PsiE [Lysinibacillus sphaericus]
MNHKHNTYQQLVKAVPKSLQLFLNVCLVLLALILSFLLMKELIEFLNILLKGGTSDYKLFLANILIFFLYFEFITMIIKYFKEDYHFPLRYFIYIGITAMIRLIIVEHDHAINTLIYALIILILIISYFIINITPLERPVRSSILMKKD